MQKTSTLNSLYFIFYTSIGHKFGRRVFFQGGIKTVAKNLTLILTKEPFWVVPDRCAFSEHNVRISHLRHTFKKFANPCFFTR